MLRPSPGSWMASPLLIATLAGVAALIALRVRAAGWRGGGAVRRPQLAALATAWLLLATATVTPIATLGAHYLLTAHLLQVTVIMGFVPPLLLLGLQGWMRMPNGRIPGAALRFLVHPAVAIVLVNLVFFGWHATPLYNACLEHEELYALQMVSLLLVSTAFWWPIVDPFGSASMSPFFKLGYILLATIPQTFAGLTFALAAHPFYGVYASAPKALGMAPLTDQQVAGACMALLSKIALFAAFSVVLLRMLAEGDHDDAAEDDGGFGHDDDDDAPLPVRPWTPAWLGMLDRGPMADEPAAPARAHEMADSR